ncbi:transposable element Tcb2 transposase [Trichonephila clavipes]|nr:transposable element Tcb2 transposase [Trichonephila clavipes]
MAALVNEYTLEFFTLLNARGKKELIEWCMKEGLIASSYECPKCNEQMGLNERKSVVLDGFEWRCQKKDESRFSLSSDSHRILIWREQGSRNHPSNIIERDRYGGRGVLVWGGIMLGSRTDLHIFDAGSVNGTRYCNEILLPYVRLFRGAMGLQFLFMDDNAPCHCTVAAEPLLESRRLAARTLPPVTIQELRLALQDELAVMSHQLIDTLILSMGRRCETCLAVRGDHIPY